MGTYLTPDLSLCNLCGPPLSLYLVITITVQEKQQLHTLAMTSSATSLCTMFINKKQKSEKRKEETEITHADGSGQSLVLPLTDQDSESLGTGHICHLPEKSPNVSTSKDCLKVHSESICLFNMDFL